MVLVNQIRKLETVLPAILMNISGNTYIPNLNHHNSISLFVSFFKQIFFYFSFRERGREGEREREKHQCVVASHVPPLGTWPAAQAYALTWNQTSDPLVCWPALNPLSHTSQGRISVFQIQHL